MVVLVSGSTTYFARLDSGTANNNALNPNGGSGGVRSITFTNNDPDIPGVDTLGDFGLNFNGGLPDPDTSIVVNGISYPFTVNLVGETESSYPNGARMSPYLDQRVVILTYTNNLGVTERVFFFPDAPQSSANMGNITNGAVGLDPNPALTCLCEGTEVLTANGVRAIETVRVGDFLLNDLGVAKQVIWIGSSAVSAQKLKRDANVRPIRIPAGALGAAGPQADLFVSPQHRVVIEGAAPSLLFGEERVLVAAKHLVQSGIAEQMNPGEEVRYFHVMLEEHELLVTNGLVTESFQPARRTLDVMSAENQARLVAAIEALGVEEMLTRPDALPSLNHRESIALGAMLKAMATGTESAEMPALRLS